MADRCQNCPHKPRWINENWVKCTNKHSDFYDKEVRNDNYCKEYDK